MKNKVKKIIFSLIIFSFLIFSILKISERVIIRKISNLPSEKVKINSIKLSFSGIKVKGASFKDNKFFVFFKELRIKPSFSINAFAFSGPGAIITENRKREINLKGRISGSVKNGNVVIKKTEIEIEKIGNIEITGRVENWGKNYVKTDFKLKGTEIKEIGKFLNFKIPIDGKIYGNAEFIKKDGKQEMKFSLSIKEINGKEKELSMDIDGKYDILKKRVEVDKGKIYGEKGEEIEFAGYIDEKNFDLEFETKGMSVETLLKFLPEKVREKYNINLKSGTLSMRNFILKKKTKNSDGMENLT